MSFIPLYVYSGYSFLKSGLTVPKIVGLSLRSNAHYVALADYGSLTGAPELLHLCKQRNLQPLIGLTVQVESTAFTCFCQDEEGYQHLLQMVLLQSQNALTREKFITLEGGLIGILNAQESPIALRFQDHPEEIPDFLRKYDQGFSGFYLGVPSPKVNGKLAEFLRAFVQTYPYSLVAFPHLAYAKPEDAITKAILEAISQGETLESKKANGPDYYLSQEEARSFFTEKEIAATEEIAQQASAFVYEKNRGGLLRYPCPDGMDSPTYLRKLAYEGLAKRVPNAGKEYQERLEHELSIIIPMGYADYFLLVGDYVHFAKTHGVSVGPGRGSGAGSLVSFCLDIVKPDPLRYGLLFERFLNPERASMPDIDVDFADIGRDSVAKYLEQKYGKNRVSHVMTMQTIGARQSVNDIGRVYSYPESETKMLSSLIDPYHDLAWNYRNNSRFRSIIDSDNYYREYLSFAHKIEGLPRQSGLHAAGIVLNDRPLEEVLPVVDQEGVGYVEQLDKDYLQEQGFYKMDLLGLTNLTYIDRILARIEMTRGIHLNYEDIPYEDPKPIAMIASGFTMGLFQLESEGMNRAIAEVHPTSFEDICAVIALFRPGPMANIPTFARRKGGKERITYLCPELEPILKTTYGVIVYQEQIMQIVRAVAGFSYGQADVFRRAISHKDAKELASLHDSFIAGCLKEGHTKDLAEQLYALIAKFADYGFNKSHSLCYALLACQLAYLKYYYPLEFYSVILDYGGGGKDKLPRLIGEIKKRRIPFLLPNINQAGLTYQPCGKGILFPLTAIRDISGALSQGIIEERTLNGPFHDFFDFALRCKKYGLDAKNLNRLIDAGCFDSLYANRESLHLTASSAIGYAELLGGGSGKEMLLDFDLPKPSYSQKEPCKEIDLHQEKEALGMMISGSPLSAKEAQISARRLHPLSELDNALGYLDVVGILASVKTIITKKGSKMAFITLFDEVAQVDITLFSEAYDKAFPYLKEGNALYLTARKDLSRPNTFIGNNVGKLE